MSVLTRPAWSPYAVGTGIGMLSWFAFLTARKPLGVTSAFESSAVVLAQNIAPTATGVNEYLIAAEEPPTLDWEWMLDVGIVIGSFMSARASRDHREPRVPPIWAHRFGRSPARRYAGAFAGGALTMLGARMAQGCTSGHGISGNLQLAASSLVFSPLMALAAAATAHALFGGRRSR